MQNKTYHLNHSELISGPGQLAVLRTVPAMEGPRPPDPPEVVAAVRLLKYACERQRGWKAWRKGKELIKPAPFMKAGGKIFDEEV